MADLNVEELQKELEATKAALESASKSSGNKDISERLTYLESENKKLIEDRDKAKQKAREIEEAKLAEQGEFKTIAEQRQAEAEELRKQLEGLSGTLEGYKARDEKEFKDLLPKVPEQFRELVSDETLPLVKRLDLARAHANVIGKAPDFRGAGEGDTSNKITRQAFDAKTPADKQKFISGGGTVTD